MYLETMRINLAIERKNEWNKKEWMNERTNATEIEWMNE